MARDRQTDYPGGEQVNVLEAKNLKLLRFLNVGCQQPRIHLGVHQGFYLLTVGGVAGGDLAVHNLLPQDMLNKQR